MQLDFSIEKTRTIKDHATIKTILQLRVLQTKIISRKIFIILITVIAINLQPSGDYKYKLEDMSNNCWNF